MSDFEDENKKKILAEQEKDFAKDKESSEPLLLTDELKAEGIEMISFSKKYLYVEDCNGHSVHVNLFKDSISRTLEYFESLINGTFDNSLKRAIKIFIAEIWDEKIKDNRTSGNGEGKHQQQKKSKSKEEKLPEEYVQKYSDANVIIESILIDNVPYFLIAENGTIRIAEFYPTEIILKPLEPTSYINRAYTFTSKEQVIQYIANTKIKTETLDTLYRTVKSIWKKYIDADDFHISICAADTIFTYSQDKIGLTHYLFFVGNNGSGKTNNLDVFHFLAYRNMLSTDITSANIYQFLGSKDEGIGTICEDELDTIDEDKEKMKTYKMGYTRGKPIFRMLEHNSGRRQTRLNTFCFKAFAAEKLPDSTKAKGFNDRLLQIHCTYGFPQYDITEVVSPAGEQKFQTLLDELNEVRNKLLIYRLLHYNDPIPDIEIDLQNREKQLFKPLLRVFQNTETFNELLPVISQFVGKKRKATQDTFIAYLYGVLMALIRNHNSYELATSDIINVIKTDLECKDIPAKPLSFESSQFGTLSQKQITNMLDEIFGATKSPHHGNNSKWTFDKDKLARLGKIYQLSPNIKIGVGEDGENIGLDKHLSNAEENKVGYDGEDGEDVQERPPISEHSLEQETSNNYNNSSNNDKEIQENDQSRASEDSKNIPLSSHNPPFPKFPNLPKLILKNPNYALIVIE